MYAVDAVRQGIKLAIKPMHSPSCLQCQNCEIVNIGRPDEFWCCETVGWGVPCKCDPPFDDTDDCQFYSTTKRFDNDDFGRFIQSVHEHMDD